MLSPGTHAVSIGEGEGGQMSRQPNTPRHPATPAHPGRRRLPTWARVLLIVASVVLAGLVLFAGMLWWSLQGGWDGIRPQAQPTDREVQSSRDQARSSLDASIEETLDPARSALGSAPASTLTADGCEHGQNNWKVHDGYTLRCTAGTIAVFRLAATSDATSVSARLGESLLAAGWQPDPEGLQVNGDGTAADGRYRRGEDRLSVRIDPPGRYVPIDVPGYFSDWSRTDVDALKAAVADQNGSTAVLVVSRTYFEDD